MPIAPWLIPPNFLAAAEAGSNAGLALRRAKDDEAQFQQRMNQENSAQQAQQSEAAQRLRQSYDALAQQHDLSQQEINARFAQAGAANALRQHGQDALLMWRQEQGKNAEQRIKDRETQMSAAAALKDRSNKDINGFWTDLAAKGLEQSLQDHPFAAAEPGIRQAAAQKLINPKGDAVDANERAKRVCVREALTKLARSAGRMTWGPFAVIKHIEEFRDREYPALSSESPPAQQNKNL